VIIDMSSSLPTSDFFLAEIQMGRGSRYVRIFGRGLARWVGMADDEIDRLAAGDSDAFVDRILQLAEANGRNTVESFVAALDEGGVDRSVLHNFHEPPTPTSAPRVDNVKVAEICARFPDRFIGFAGVSPHDGPKAVEEVNRAVRELGLQGVAIRPFRQKLRANDPLYYPIYQRCLELGVPVWLHTSNHFFSDVSLDFARPIYLDQVACDF
jgi:predicted TIM-barrel fold metal-dependent hydrolase